MIIIMNPGSSKEEIENVETRLQNLGFKTHPIYGEIKTVIGAIGNKSLISTQDLLNMSGVENVVPIMKPYKLAGKELKKDPTVIKVDNVEIGGNNVVVIAGPCAIENEESYIKTALEVKNAGAKILRGGAFKPRSSPYAFQGLEEEGLKIMSQAKKVTGLPLVSEVLDTREVDLVAKYCDILQIGARNMQNFRLLKEVGNTNKPVLLKRGLSATIEEFLMSAEYIISSGNPNVILCERGIRTFETATRNTLDISAIPVLKELSHLPIMIDPSHASGTWKYVNPLSKAAIAAGADGLIIEVHSDPGRALCDGPQSLKPSKFSTLMNELSTLSNAVGKYI